MLQSWQVQACFCSEQTDVAACRFQNEYNKVEIALPVTQFLRSCDFVIKRLISDQIPLSAITVINLFRKFLAYLKIINSCLHKDHLDINTLVIGI